MNIFNYLMNKKGHEIFDNDDILSYLLKKGRVHRATGTEITIHNAKGFNSLEMTKLSTQDGTPTPDNPVEVNTVKGYKNLFNKDNANTLNAFINSSPASENYKKITSNSNARTIYISCQPNTTYTISRIAGQRFTVGSCVDIPTLNVICTNEVHKNTATSLTITTGENDKYLCVFYYLSTADTLTEEQIRNSIQITESATELPYVLYGTNYIYTTISDGTNSKIITIPLNDNEICGIGDYKDELVIDKLGNAKLIKNIGKVVLNGSENWVVSSTNTSGYNRFTSGVIYNLINKPSATSQVVDILSNYFIKKSADNTYQRQEGISVGTNGNLYIYGDSLKEYTQEQFTTWLSTHNTTVYYVLATPTEIDLGTVDMELYEGNNNITNSENMDMVLEYYK